MTPAKKHANRHRPRRSVLYMPSSNPRALEKAKTITCDALILDLEDAVAPDAKEGARDAACAAVKSGEYGRKELIIRVNALNTEWHYPDMMAACKAGPRDVYKRQLLAWDRHVLVCTQCRYAVDQERGLLASLRSAPEPCVSESLQALLMLSLIHI